MTVIVHKLATDLKRELRQADELWIAVALITKEGLNYVLENAPTSCRQNYVVGIDLPTDPKALKTLHDLELTNDFAVGLFLRKEFYHPKVYLMRHNKKYTAFLGSANCTSGGLNNNIEISVKLKDQQCCKHLLTWFEGLQKSAKPLTRSFLDTYTADYETRRTRKKEDERKAKQEKQRASRESEATLEERSKFLKVLRKYRAFKDYHLVKRKRDEVVNALRDSLGYPDFSDIDIDGFFSIWELGHIISLPKPTIKRQLRKFSRLMTILCDDRIDIATRYDKALQGRLKIRGVSEGLISKVLTVHDPQNYFVKNAKSDIALKKYGIQMPRGLSRGEKYKITSKFLKHICKEAKIHNLAILDYYLYLEGRDNE